MTLQQIEMHFNEIINLSIMMKEHAKALHRISQEEILQVTSLTKVGWKSVCANIYMQKEVKISEQLIQEAQQLLKLAVKMEEQAMAMYRAEIRNSDIAATRVYQ